MMRSGSGMSVLWPEDGAIISPIFVLTKKEKKELVQPISDFLASKPIGDILAQNGLFPSTNPKVENIMPENHPFMWLGWDYIYEHDLTTEIKRCIELFYSGGNS